jgi:hypothetical protein
LRIVYRANIGAIARPSPAIDKKSIIYIIFIKLLMNPFEEGFEQVPK